MRGVVLPPDAGWDAEEFVVALDARVPYVKGALLTGDEGVTPRLLRMSLPGVPEDRRPTKMPPGPSLGPLVAPT